VRSDEPPLYPVRSFTYRTEHVRANEVQKLIVYGTMLDKSFQCDVQFNFLAPEFFLILAHPVHKM